MPTYFISYRRSDTEGAFLAHMIFRELRHQYGEGSAFLDVDSGGPGQSFPDKIEQALGKSDAVFVVIGPDWLKELQARSQDQRDWVRYEVSESLKRSFLPVVPICRLGVAFPREAELPEELAGLAWRDGVAIDPLVDFDSHLARLLGHLTRVVAESKVLAAAVPRDVALDTRKVSRVKAITQSFSDNQRRILHTLHQSKGQPTRTSFITTRVGAADALVRDDLELLFRTGFVHRYTDGAIREMVYLLLEPGAALLRVTDQAMA
jgi:hypothetical protein